MTREERQSCPVTKMFCQEPQVMRRSRSLSELPGHLRVPILHRTNTERTMARLEAGAAGVRELHELRQQQQQLMDHVIASACQNKKRRTSQLQTDLKSGHHGHLTPQYDHKSGHNKHSDLQFDHKSGHHGYSDIQFDHHQRLQKNTQEVKQQPLSGSSSLVRLSAISLASISEERDSASPAWMEQDNPNTWSRRTGTLRHITDQLQYQTVPHQQQILHCQQHQNKAGGCQSQHQTPAHISHQCHYLDERTVESNGLSHSLTQDSEHDQVLSYVGHHSRPSFDSVQTLHELSRAPSSSGRNSQCPSVSQDWVCLPDQHKKDQHVHYTSSITGGHSHVTDMTVRRRAIHLQTDERFIRGRSQSVHESFLYFPGPSEDTVVTRGSSYHRHPQTDIQCQRGTHLHHCKSDGDSTFLCQPRTNDIERHECECQTTSFLAQEWAEQLSVRDPTPSSATTAKCVSHNSKEKTRNISWKNLLIAVGIDTERNSESHNIDKDIVGSDLDASDDDIFENVLSYPDDQSPDAAWEGEGSNRGLSRKAVRSQSFTGELSMDHNTLTYFSTHHPASGLPTNTRHHPINDLHHNTTHQPIKYGQASTQESVYNKYGLTKRTSGNNTAPECVRKLTADKPEHVCMDPVSEDMVSAVQVRRASFQCDAVLTRDITPDKITHPLQDVDITSLCCPGPLHAIMLQYRDFPVKKISDSLPLSTDQSSQGPDQTPVSSFVSGCTHPAFLIPSSYDSQLVTQSNLSSCQRHDSIIVSDKHLAADTQTGVIQNGQREMLSEDTNTEYSRHQTPVNLLKFHTTEPGVSKSVLCQEKETLSSNCAPGLKMVCPANSDAEDMQDSSSHRCVRVNTNSTSRAWPASAEEISEMKHIDLMAFHEMSDIKDDSHRQTKVQNCGGLSTAFTHHCPRTINELHSPICKLGHEAAISESVGVYSVKTQLLENKVNVDSEKLDENKTVSQVQGGLVLCPSPSCPSPEVRILSHEEYRTCDTASLSANVSWASSGTASSMSCLKYSPSYLHISQSQREPTSNFNCSEPQPKHSLSPIPLRTSGTNCDGDWRGRKAHTSAGYENERRRLPITDLENSSCPPLSTGTTRRGEKSFPSAGVDKTNIRESADVTSEEEPYGSSIMISSGGSTREVDPHRQCNVDSTFIPEHEGLTYMSDFFPNQGGVIQSETCAVVASGADVSSTCPDNKSTIVEPGITFQLDVTNCENFALRQNVVTNTGGKSSKPFRQTSV